MEDPRELDVSTGFSPSISSTHSASHHISTPTRRNEHMPWLRHRPILSRHLLFLIFLTCCFSLSSATIYLDEQMVEAQDASEDWGSALERLALSGEILVDPNYQPRDPIDWTHAATHGDLKRRDNQDGGSTTTTSGTKTSSTASSSSSSSTGLLVAATTAPSPMPVPFDLGFSHNITDGCQSFMTAMLSNSTFKSCLPFSLLIQNSNSFFQASKSVTRITQTLDYTCAANFNTCSKLMSTYSLNITTSSACASDLAAENPLITYAHLGLQAYKPLYTASCLRNPSTSAYCFADAITNASNPADTYIYVLPLNTTLPGGSQPTCNACLKETMAVFGAATSDRSSALATDYVGAAMQVNLNCGPGFVNQSLAAAITSSASSSSSPLASLIGIFAFVVLAMSWLL